jgi:hypothetical protein
VIDLVTNRWNAILLSGDRVRRALLPGRGASPLKAGDTWEGSASERRWAPNPPSPEEWTDVVARREDPDASGTRGTRGRIAWLSSVNEAYVFGDERGVQGETSHAERGESQADAAASFERYLGLRAAALDAPPGGWLLPQGRTGPGRPYPHALGLREAEPFDSLIETFRALAERSERVSGALAAAVEDPETAELRDALAERRDRAKKKIRALESELAAGSEAEAIRELGHILLARKNDVPRGAEEVTLADFSGESITIELDPQRDAPANAAVYYERAKRLDRAVAKLPSRIDRARQRTAKLESALERLESDGPDESLWKLAGRRPGTAASGGRGSSGRGSQGAGPQMPRLPYRRYRTTGGLEIRAGRSAKDNDELTFHHSAPDDIWMHVREAPGSHVVLRWGRKDQNPPESDIAEAALVAAVLSRARGSRLVPASRAKPAPVRSPSSVHKPCSSSPIAPVPNAWRTTTSSPSLFLHL